MRIPYDETWKDIVVELINDFLAMFLPDLNAQVNSNIPPVFLEQELHAAIKDKTIKIADKLVRVKLKNGEDKWVFIHIEFETSPDVLIGERMFQYYHRIYEKYGKDITALVIYTGSIVPKKYDRYNHKVFGTSIDYTFNTYQVKKQNEKALLENNNPFAIIVLANLYTLQSKDDDAKRLILKEKIYEVAKSRGYSRSKTEKLLIFVFELIKLEPDFEKKFDAYVNESLNKTDMPYVTDVTRNLVDSMTLNLFGESYKDLKAEREKTEKSLINSIVFMYTKSNLTVDEISEILQTDKDFVKQTLKSKKLLKE